MKTIENLNIGYSDAQNYIQRKNKSMLYNSNLIAAVVDNGKYFHFSYREKSLSNINPMVLIDSNVTYRFHYGMYKKTKKGRY